MEVARPSKPRGQRTNRIAHAKLTVDVLPALARPATRCLLVPVVSLRATKVSRVPESQLPLGVEPGKEKGLNSKVLQVIVFQLGSPLRGPTIQFLLAGERLIAVRLLIRKSLLARIDGIHD